MIDKAVETLLVEDNPSDVELTLHSLRSSITNHTEAVRQLGLYWRLLNQSPL